MAGPKITVIGAGSYFFGKAIIRKMADSGVLAGGTLALVDTKPDVLRTMAQLARRVFRSRRCGVKVLASIDRRKVMADSDFVLLSFSHRNAHYRGVDTQIAARHGMLMCSSDTIGPGGIFRAMRETPHVLAVARDAKRLAPNAWLINFINPTTVLGIVLQRYAPQVRSFALCDGHHEPHHTLLWCKLAGIVAEDATAISPEVQAKLDLCVAGVNHCTWILRFTYDGKDMMPRVRRDLARRVREERKEPGDHSKRRYNAAYQLQLFDLYGAYPTAIGHTKEYVPFFQGHGAAPVKPEPITLFDGELRAREMAEAWEKTRGYASGKLGVSHFMRHIRPDHASDIIEQMWGNLGQAYYINTANRGAVTNMANDAFLELRCDIDMHGPRPQPVGVMPRGLLALQQQVLDTHELTAEAAVTGDRTLLRRAMLTDPICNNITDADACIADLLEAEREALPKYWYRQRR